MDREIIKELFEETGKDDTWLADICEADVETLQKWLAGLGFMKEVTVRLVMVSEGHETIEVDFDLEKYLEIEIGAKAKGMSVGAYLSRIIAESVTMPPDTPD